MDNVGSVSKTNYPEISLRQLAGCEAEKKKTLDLDITTNQFSRFTATEHPLRIEFIYIIPYYETAFILLSKIYRFPSN